MVYLVQVVLLTDHTAESAELAEYSSGTSAVSARSAVNKYPRTDGDENSRGHGAVRDLLLRGWIDIIG